VIDNAPAGADAAADACAVCPAPSAVSGMENRTVVTFAGFVSVMLRPSLRGPPAARFGLHRV
jgi:hypothetical protein